MRIVFVNLHTNAALVKTASKYIFKQSVAIKHKYLIDYLINETDFEICSYVNKQGTSIANNLPKLFMTILISLRFVESSWVLKKNGLFERVKILKDLSDIKHDDLVILYQLFASKSIDVGKVNAFKVMSLLHFDGTRSNSEDIRICSPQMLFCESNLYKHSDVFQKYYDWCHLDIMVHPFVPEKRFKIIKPFNERKNKVFSTGTITYKKHQEFLDVYGDSCDQPIRKYVKDHQEELKGLIDCYSSDFSEDAKAAMEFKMGDSKLIKTIKSGYYKFFGSQQKSYYSFNMVEKFNDYKMCLIGEEILGVPGIGFVEGMACGCAYIGRRGYYEDYGMQEGIHYIGYDGTTDDLKDTIRYYQMQEHQRELEGIARNGYLFVKEHFDGNVVAKELIDCFIEKQKAFLSNQ